MLNILKSYPSFDSARCTHKTRYSVGNPPKWKCVECSLLLLNDSRIPLINKYTAIDELCYAAENKLDFDKVLSCGQDVGAKLARVLIDFSLSNLVLEEYAKRLQELVISLLESPNSCQQRQHVLSHLLMKINNIPLTRKQGPALCLFVELTERFNGSEFATNPSQISHLLDKLIYFLLEPDPSLQTVILRGISSMLQHWSIGILSELQLTRLAAALVQIVDRSDSQAMYSQSFIIFSTLLQQTHLRPVLCRALAPDSSLRACVEAVKKLLLSSDTNWQTSGLHFLLELISLEPSFLEFCLAADAAEYLLECSAGAQLDSILQLVLANLSVFCKENNFFSQMHHLFAVQPLCKILKLSLESESYQSVLTSVGILTRLFEVGAARGPVISREEDFAKSIKQLKGAVGHHNYEIAIASSQLLALILKQDLTSSLQTDSEVMIVSLLSEIHKRITTMDKSEPLLKQEYRTETREINDTFQDYFSAILCCELSALKAVFAREIKQVARSDAQSGKELKEYVLVFYEQFILPTFLEFLYSYSPRVTTHFCHITLELACNIPQSLELVSRLVESALIQNLWSIRLQRREEEMEMSVNHLIKQFCCVLVCDQEENVCVSEYIDSFLGLRIGCTFNEITKFMIENVTSGRMDQQIIGFVSLLYLTVQRSVVELLYFKQFLTTISLHLFNRCSMPSRRLKHIILKYVVFLISYLSNSEDIGVWGNQPSIMDSLEAQLRSFSDNLSLLYTHHILIIRFVYCVNEPCLAPLRMPFLRLWLIHSKDMAEQEAEERGEIMLKLILASTQLPIDIGVLSHEYQPNVRTGMFILLKNILISPSRIFNEIFLKTIISSLEHSLTTPRNELLDEESINQLLQLLILAYQLHYKYTTPSIKLSYQLINLVINDNYDNKTISNAFDLINATLKVEANLRDQQVLTLTVGHQDFLARSFKKYFNKDSNVFQHFAFLISTLIKQCIQSQVAFPIELQFEVMLQVLMTTDHHIRSGALNVMSRVFETKQLSLFQEFKKEKFKIAPSKKLLQGLSGLVFLLYNLMVDTDASTQENATSCLTFLIDCAYSFHWDDKSLKDLFTNKWNDYLLEALFLGLVDIRVIVITHFCKKLITKVYSQNPSDKSTLYNQVFKLFTTTKLSQLSSLAFYEFFRESIPQLESTFVRDTLDTVCDTFEAAKKSAVSDSDRDMCISGVNIDQTLPITHILSIQQRGIEINALRINL